MKISEFETNNIYCADCYEAIRKLPDKCIDLVITDPPYETSVNHGAGAFGVKKKLHYEQFVSISNGFDFSILDELCRILKKINLYIWCSTKQIPVLLDYFVTKRGCYWNLICWHKSNTCPTCNNKYMPDTEYCLFFREKGVKIYGNAKSKTTYYVGVTNKIDKCRFGHPTIKPLNIIENFIINSSQPNDIVLDCFLGSGTTCVGAKNQGRQYLGFEIDKEKWQAAYNRLNNIQASGQMTLWTM